MALGGGSASVTYTPTFAYVANNGCPDGGKIVPGTISAYTINASSGHITAVSGSPFAAGLLKPKTALPPQPPVSHAPLWLAAAFLLPNLGALACKFVFEDRVLFVQNESLHIHSLRKPGNYLHTCGSGGYALLGNTKDAFAALNEALGLHSSPEFNDLIKKYSAKKP